jgi:putative Mn2+ efflux pump MntP
METIVTSLLIGLGLAMDCLAVSFAAGANQRAARVKTALILAVFFGGFQCGMTVLGWLLGTGFADTIAAYDHWIAAGLLGIIGAKMLIEGCGDGREEEAPDVIHLIPVVTLAIATSIDALAVGISYAFLKVEPLIPAVIIGMVAAVISVAGVYSGGKAGHILGRRVDILGGVILIGIGLKILLDHTIWS